MPEGEGPQLTLAPGILSAILDTSGALILVQDREGRILSFNRGCEQATGYSFAEVRGKPPWEFLLGAEEGARMRAALARRTPADYPSKSEENWVARGGEVRVISWSTTALLDEAGAIRYLVGVGIDITEHKRLEDQLLQMQKMEAVGRLAGGLAHDFNNLLTAINGYSGLVLESIDEGDPLRRDVEEIQRAGERAAALTRQLLAFSRKQVLRPKPVNLNSVVEGMERMLRRLIGEDLELVIRLEPGLASITADPTQMEQVLLNLVVNARDAMPGGGRLTIETANLTARQAASRRHLGLAPSAQVVLSVTDTGCGMDAETRARLFEPFFTTKEHGTGLGLSTVYGVVRQSGGIIQVESEPGRGSCFRVYLPRTEDRAPGAAARESERAAPQGWETVLVVEDDPEVRRLVGKVLRKNGYRVLEAGHGGEALALARGHAGPIHLLIADVVMPKMGGPELASHLRMLRPGLKLLYMSGYEHKPSPALGGPFLQKPFPPEVLAQKVRAALDEG